MKFLFRTDDTYGSEWYSIEADTVDDALREIAENEDPQRVELVRADDVMVFKQERAPFVRVPA